MTIDDITQDIALSVPWIGRSRERVETLNELLHEAETARSSEGPALVVQLLNRFTFLTTELYESLLLEIATFISDGFDLDRTILCATTADRQKDSAQRVLYDLVSTLAGIGKYKVRNLNRYDVAHQENDVDSLVLIDEFIGSGRSLAGRARNLRRIFQQKGKPSPAIHGIAVAGMTHGLRSISAEFDSLNVCIALQKGIESHSTPAYRANAYAVMHDMESALAPTYYGEVMPSLGYAAAEALYFRHSGSCPNNVFPIFWWPHRISATNRRPMFPRAL